MGSILDGLNPDQQKAAAATEGPVLILAGAGSGKTRTLMHRLAYLLLEKNIPAYNVLAVTFTNKAAKEMQMRLGTLMGSDVSNPMIGTFHSVCARILRVEAEQLGFDTQFAIYDPKDAITVIKEIMENFNLDANRTNPKAVLAHISEAKSQLLLPDDYEAQADDYFSQLVARIYRPYVEKLKLNNAMDFDDLLLNMYLLLKNNSSVREKYQERFRYILVDEYQDTNQLQYNLVKLWSEKYRNLCCVGDDWQGIYSWRGATIRNILDFEKDYPDARVIKLEQNYRSTKVILEAAQNVIDQNKARSEKKLWTDNDKGAKIRVVVAEDERSEARSIVSRIAECMKNGSNKYNDFAILYRVNAQSRSLEEAFLEYGIPYKIIGGVKFYERAEVKDILAYLKVIANPKDQVSLLRIINVPPRKVGAKTIADLRSLADQLNLPISEVIASVRLLETITPLARKALADFVDLITDLRELAKTESHVVDIIKLILKNSGYRNYILDGSEDGERRYENIQELLTAANKYSELEPWQSLSKFLEDVALISDIDTMQDKDNAVLLLTLHSAKGLEFPYVFIPGLEEGIFPHSRSFLEPEQMEEERRLMYVGLTRAKREVMLLAANRRYFYGGTQNNPLSRFLDDIPSHLIDSKKDETRTREAVKSKWGW